MDVYLISERTRRVLCCEPKPLWYGQFSRNASCRGIKLTENCTACFQSAAFPSSPVRRKRTMRFSLDNSQGRNVQCEACPKRRDGSDGEQTRHNVERSSIHVASQCLLERYIKTAICLEVDSYFAVREIIRALSST